MSAAYWWIVLLTYCHVGPVNFHIVSEPDFPNLDFPWSVWEVMLHVSHLAENIRSVSPMTCDRTPNVELFSCSVTVPLSFHLSTLALSLCVPCWLCLSAWFCHLSIIFSVSLSPSSGLLDCPIWTTSAFPLCCLSLSSFLVPSLLTPSFCPLRIGLCLQSHMD